MTNDNNGKNSNSAVGKTICTHTITYISKCTRTHMHLLTWPDTHTDSDAKACADKDWHPTRAVWTRRSRIYADGKGRWRGHRWVTKDLQAMNVRMITKKRRINHLKHFNMARHQLHSFDLQARIEHTQNQCLILSVKYTYGGELAESFARRTKYLAMFVCCYFQSSNSTEADLAYHPFEGR